MSQLLVVDIDEALVDALKRQAAENDRSVEAEHREILRAHLARAPKKRSLKEVLAEMPYMAGQLNIGIWRPHSKIRN